MRIKFGRPPKYGDERIKERFLFFPKIIDYELRWLCRARWKQQYCFEYTSGFPTWHDVNWLDDEEHCIGIKKNKCKHQSDYWEEECSVCDGNKNCKILE